MSFFEFPEELGRRRRIFRDPAALRAHCSDRRSDVCHRIGSAYTDKSHREQGCTRVLPMG
jgi:hypothetical protein